MIRPIYSALPVVCLLVAACDGPAASPRDDAAAVLREIGRIELAEILGDPIVGVDYVGIRPGGGYLLADRHAGRIRLFDDHGNQVQVVGRPGEGPGELQEPGGAVEFPDGEILVVQRADPRLTIFRPDTAPLIREVPGHYGYWAERATDRVVAGVATQDTRFAMIGKHGEVLGVFGARDPSVASTPFWIYFAADHAAVIGDHVAVNTSLFPTIRMFDLAGDSVGSFSVAPSAWVQADAPPVADLRAPGSRERLEQWARTFSVVRQVAAVGDSTLVVQFGRHDPRQADPYYVIPMTADVYSTRGERLAEGLELPGPVVGGGERLLVLVAEPPDPWTIAVFEWIGPGH